MKKNIITFLAIVIFGCAAIVVAAVKVITPTLTASIADIASIDNDPSSCVLSLSNTTFFKSYRILVFTKINGAWPTKDGGYIVSGTTDPNIMFIPPDGFVAKLDKKGGIQWMKLLKTKNAAGAGNPLGDEDVQSIIELKSGGYLMVSKVWGFITAKEWSADNVELDKIMFTKLDKNGNMIWSKSFTGFVEDAKNSLLETADNGFLFYTNITDLTPDKVGEDSDVYFDQPYSSLKVFKFDQNGNIQWSKNIKNFIARENDSYLIPTPDGGYALAGNLTQSNPEKDPPYNFDTYPGLAKFDKNFNFEWAKSIEGIPLEMAAVITKPEGGLEMGWKEMRQGAIVVQGLAKTKDNGYIVFGNLSAALSLITDSNSVNSKPKNSLMGFKFSSSGNLEWAKKITLSFNDFSGPMTNYSIISTTDNKIIIAGPNTWADDDCGTKMQDVNDQRKWYVEKYGEMEMLKEGNQKTKQSQEDWKKVQAAIKAATEASHGSILTIKTDQELNIDWIKEIEPPKSGPLTNYVMKATPDSGAIIAGEYTTDVVQSVLLSSITYYKDGFLVKLDGSGNVKNNAGWVVDYNDKIITEITTLYATTNDLISQTDSYSVKLTSRKPEFSVYKKTKTTTYVSPNNSKNTLCPTLPNVFAYNTPVQNSNLASTATRTWPEINYERAIPSELINDKSRTIDGELLPILNQLYNNQVKMTDNMDGSMLDYIFPRIVTKDDVTAVKNHLEGLGYRTQDEGLNQLTMYKPGYWLIMTFSTDHPDKAFLEITF
ncbi:MAG: hypothetical protein PHE59_02570 [Patescibacteria group bacterium]|nr:hypothetical protein [Patescibacteria group bacterium]MDD5164353.1 hypothetical protein [Patescibacteria group bacterium]MDD5534279.1 hypothetical protein [Patescibacteria group bacterium]